MATFWIIGGIGLVLLLVMLLVGDVLDGLNHLEFLDSEFFSAASIAGFLGAFGFTGAGVLSLTHSNTAAIVAGAFMGALFGWLVAWATKKLKEGETDAVPRTQNLVGASGTVISAIPEDGFGEVRVFSGGQPLKLNARGERALPGGTRVWVSDVLSATSVLVRSSDPLDDGDPLPEIGS